uniref:Fatty acyl-CoA reductase n=1 Tax=Nicotiana sylvestris TaxID=4096 RepID=A0A1U7W5S3_NICSY|nr:PREDICTED: fatty acyl-CoA reductase 2-like [Nicotiana sylvestris]
MHDESYKSFIRSKLVPVVGNIHEPHLGMDITTAHQIAEEIDLIVDSAANTNFDESQGNRPCNCFLAKGVLPGTLGDPNCLIDMVPVDMVVNATMAAIAKHGYVQSPQLNVYHVASASVNPVSVSQLFDYCYEYFDSFPFVNSKGDRVKLTIKGRKWASYVNSRARKASERPGRDWAAITTQIVLEEVVKLGPRTEPNFETPTGLSGELSIESLQTKTQRYSTTCLI